MSSVTLHTSHHPELRDLSPTWVLFVSADAVAVVVVWLVLSSSTWAPHSVILLLPELFFLLSISGSSMTLIHFDKWVTLMLNTVSHFVWNCPLLWCSRWWCAGCAGPVSTLARVSVPDWSLMLGPPPAWAAPPRACSWQRLELGPARRQGHTLH